MARMTEKTDNDVMALCDRIRGASLALHRYLGPGHLEKVYENGLRHRLHQDGIRVESQVPLEVRDEDGYVLGEYFADLCVDSCLIVELKAASSLCNEHISQLLGYLRACRMRHGLLINFGAPRLQIKKLKL